MLARLILILALLLGPCANAQISLTGAGAGGSVISGGTTYIGPGDVVSGATAWYGLRGYNAAFATGSKAAINVRRATDNTTSDINILANGNLDIATAEYVCRNRCNGDVHPGPRTTATCASASARRMSVRRSPATGVTQPCLHSFGWIVYRGSRHRHQSMPAPDLVRHDLCRRYVHDDTMGCM